jgi:hypothetical protein
VLTSPLGPLSSQSHWQATTDIYGWRGDFRREGTSPPLIFSPPLEQLLIRVYGINLFERGIQGVSIDEQPNVNSTIRLLILPVKSSWYIIIATNKNVKFRR